MAVAEVPPAQPKRRFTRDEFHRMADAGVFGEEERLELVDGEIVPMSPQGPKHISATRRSARQMRRVFGEEDWSVREEKALALGDSRERYPDVAVARGGDAEYDDRIAEPADVVLVIGVADTTLATDRDVKGLEYALSGIPEYWIVNLTDRSLEVYREPTPSGYGLRTIFAPGDQVPVEFAGSALVAVADLLPLH